MTLPPMANGALDSFVLVLAHVLRVEQQRFHERRYELGALEQELLVDICFATGWSDMHLNQETQQDGDHPLKYCAKDLFPKGRARRT